MRMRLTVLALLTTVLFAGLVPPGAVAQTAPTGTTSSLIVKVIAGVTPDQQAAIVARNGGTLTSSIPALRLLVVSVPQDEVAATLTRYQADAQVQTAEANKVRVSESMPSDALYANQWALPRIGWDQVFGVVTPSGSAKVALLDTGVDASHPELAGKVVPGTSILDGSNGLTDPSGHGTWLAGIIAAQTNNGLEGIAGVAYDGVTIMPVTVLNANGEGQDSDVIAGVIWAADHGADVILMAFSNPGFSPNLQDAIDYAWSKGAIIVASAGNNASSDPHFPSGDRGVMGVAATDQNDAQAFFSNEGQAVFIAAPGVDIQTVQPGDAYTQITGTSAAAAHVAAAAAFMKAVNPAIPNGVIVYRLASTADPAGTPIETGNGRINMARALTSTVVDFIQPAGAAPVGAGGPFVGPYTADNHVLELSCVSPVQVNTTSSCTATGTNGSTGQPWAGKSITFSGGTGIFNPTSCIAAGNATTASCTTQFTPSAPGNHVLTATATGFNQGHNSSDTFTLTATPANSPPSIAANNASITVTEGGTATNTGTWSDPNAADNIVLNASVGTVTKSGTNASGTWTWSFPTTDGHAQSQTVTITANDGTTTASTTFTLTVDNETPVVATPVVTPEPSNEGSTATASATFTDANPNDTPFSCTVNYGDGSGSLAGTVVGTTCTGPAHTYLQNGSYTVTISVSDKDSGTGSNSATHVVLNVPPVVAVPLVTPEPSTEGGAATASATFTDANPNDTPFTCTVDYGDASGALAGTIVGTTCTGPAHTYADNGSFTVTVAVTDKDGATGMNSKIHVVSNVRPTITQVTGPSAPVAVNTPVTLTAAFTDPGINDTHTCSFDWDDGSVDSNGPVGPIGTGPGSCAASYTFTRAGVFTVRVTVTDKDGDTSDPYKFEYVVVYDPNAGFVTGGGWIMSPAGAYRADMALTGKANFGFVSKYKKGATVPTGETEFQFHAGGFNFHSSTYQYLVIAGSKAQYKGEGTVNGGGYYGFILTATDGNLKGSGPDTFRIKIWDKTDGDAIVYDNVDGNDTEDIDYVQTQAISGGSIVIHSGK
jgi:subtilisin family serine protease/PKD repeat protein